MKPNVLIFACAAMIFAKTAYACGCLGIPSVEEEFSKASYIVVGKVTNRYDVFLVGNDNEFSRTRPKDYLYDNPNIYGFTISPILQFKKKGTVDVYTDASSSCGQVLEKDSWYIIYTLENKFLHNAPFLYGCGRTRKLTEAEANLLVEIYTFKQLEKKYVH
jgi:hypothetical protein